MFNYWDVDIDSVFEKLNSNIEGIFSEEASKRLDEYGKNECNNPKKETLINRILRQFKDI